MITFIAWPEGHHDKYTILNADTREEAIKYVIARQGLLSDTYVLYDHDCHGYTVTVTLTADAEVRAEETPRESREPTLTANATG